MAILKAIRNQNKGCVTDDQVSGSVDTENSRKYTRKDVSPMPVSEEQHSGRCGIGRKPCGELKS
jgi:hypothetical protein